MSDINELLHAITLSERLAEGVAREADRYPTENMTRVREALASARIRLEELAISADVDLTEDHAVLDDRLRRAMAAIAKAKGVQVECDPYAVGEVEVTKDISKTGDVTIILTSPDGEKRVVSVEDYNADIIADYLKSGTVQERLAKAQLALAEAKLLMQVPERVRRLLSAQHPRIDEITEAEAAKLVDDRRKRRSEAIESALQHLHRTDPAIRNRVSEMLWAQNIAA